MQESPPDLDSAVGKAAHGHLCALAAVDDLGDVVADVLDQVLGRKHPRRARGKGALAQCSATPKPAATSVPSQARGDGVAPYADFGIGRHVHVVQERVMDHIEANRALRGPRGRCRWGPAHRAVRASDPQVSNPRVLGRDATLFMRPSIVSRMNLSTNGCFSGWASKSSLSLGYRCSCVACRHTARQAARGEAVVSVSWEHVREACSPCDGTYVEQCVLGPVKLADHCLAFARAGVLEKELFDDLGSVLTTGPRRPTPPPLAHR